MVLISSSLGRRLRKSFFCFLLIAGLSANLKAQGKLASGPVYESPKTKEIITRVIEAHGGMKNWQAAKTVSFQYTIFFAPEKLWFNSFEMTEKSTWRSYQDLDVPEQGQIGWDGTEVWSVNIKEGEPPRSRVNFHYTTLCLPWLIQGDGTNLGAPGTGKLPEDDAHYITIPVSLICYSGCTTDGNHARYLMFIDAKTYLIKGVQYFISYGAFLDLMELPKEVKSFGPLTHVYSQYMTIDGLMIPQTYVTYNPMNEPMVYHLIHNFSLKRTFDKARMVMPANAVVDNSSPFRKKD